MPLVSKCCCCCDLKYGCFTYGILYMMGRVCALTSLYFMSSAVFISKYHEDRLSLVLTRLSTIGTFIGWLLVTSVAFFIALKGIVQEKSVLIYPHLVYTILETTIVILVTTVLALTVNPMLIINAVIGEGINIYALICLISLYQHIKEGEKRSPKLKNNVGPAV